MMHAPVASPALPSSSSPSSSSSSSSSSANTSAGGRLVSTTGRALPLLGTSLSVDAAGGIARVVVEQRFHNPHAEPLVVTYSLPLPADGAVSGFAFRVGGRRVVGEVDRKQVARERYEQALIEGRSAAILEQDRSSLFTQEIGNIPPGEEIIAEVVIDQRLVWIDEGAWEWRFPTVVGPRYLGERGRVPDAVRVSQDIAEGPLPARLTLSCVVRDAIVDGGRAESPSHALTSFETRGAVRIELKEKQGARLDRDVVVRWPVAAPEVGLTLDTGRAPAPHARAATAYGLLTVVPPSVEGARRSVARDLIVLLDTSGSMGGEPLAQAQRITTALIATLRDGDQLELIEFSSAARRWKRGPVAADAKARSEANAWVRALHASGSTEMRDGILAAMSSLRDSAQRQIVLITDGLIGFESQVVAAIAARLPSSSRLHTVGVGSAVNRSLTGPAARAGHGLEVVIGIGEDPERAVARLLARTSAPLLVELALSGPALLDHAPLKLPDLFAGAPALISVALRPSGGELCVRGRTVDGAWEQRLHVAAIAAGAGNQAAVALFAREAVEDLETHLAGGGDAREINATIEGLGVDFQIATRLTSWVAVSRDATVDPRDPLRRERMPHELPHGLSAEGVGLRSPSPSPDSFAESVGYAGAPLMRSMPAPKGVSRSSMLQGPMALARLGRAMPKPESESLYAFESAPPPPPSDPADTFDLASLCAFESAPPPPPSVPADPFSRGGPGPSEPTKSEAAREEVSFLDKVKRVLGFGSSAEEAKRAAPRLELRGRVARHNPGELVIEIFAAYDSIQWSPGATARIDLANGTIVTATVDFMKTTRAGYIVVAASARLVLDLPMGTPLIAPTRILLDLDGVMLVVYL